MSLSALAKTRACAGLLLLSASLALAPPSALAQDSAPPAPLTAAQIYQRLDPQMAQVVQLWNMLKGTPTISLSPQDARQQVSVEDAAKALGRMTGVAPAPMPVGSITDGLTVPGVNGNQIPIRIYTPAGAGPFPVVVYYHGGGFVIATIDTYDASARALCNYANAIVVSVEYRKAPEAPFPAARNDAISAYKWTIATISTYNGIPSKVAVAGESAGGNLAAEVAIDARDENIQRPTHQLLVYPEVSSSLNGTSNLLYTDPVLPLTTPALVYFDTKYLPDLSQALNPDVTPYNADLHNLAPATIIAAELDPLLGDGAAYYTKLYYSGNPVQFMQYNGVTHEFFGLGAVVNIAQQAEQYGAARLAASFQ